MMGGWTNRGPTAQVFKATITESRFPDGHFSLSALTRLEALTGIDILGELQSNCLHVMVASSLELNIEKLLHTYGRKLKDFCRAVFEEWLGSQSPLAPTWRNLMKVLRDIDLGNLAKRIEQFFQPTTKSTKKVSEVMGEEKELVDSLQQTLAKVERELLESEEQHKLALEEKEKLENVLQIKIESLNTEIEVLRQQLKQLTPVKPTGYLRGVHVIGETSLLVTNEAKTFYWAGYGMKFHIPQGSLPAGVGECRIDVMAGLRGQFEFPEDSELPLTVEIQHCAASSGSSNLRFVLAKCSQKKLPYTFKTLQGGVVVPHSSYGSITLSHFSLLGIIASLLFPNVPKRCYAQIFYSKHDQRSTVWSVTFVITPNLEACISTVSKRYSAMIPGPDQEVQFEKEEITFVAQDSIQDGWTIIPLTKSRIRREEVDGFEPGCRIPSCQLRVKWTKDEPPVALVHEVKLEGAKGSDNFFNIVIDCIQEDGTTRPRDEITPTSENKPKLKDLMDALYHKVANKWKPLGVQLEIPEGTLATIAERKMGDPQLCLLEMLEWWLKRVDPPATWSAIADAVEFLGEEQLARELRQKYYQQSSENNH